MAINPKVDATESMSVYQYGNNKASTGASMQRRVNVGVLVTFDYYAFGIA
jgi:hypothetical protein